MVFLSADVLYYFGSEEHVLIVVDFKVVLSQYPQQFVYYLNVDELALFLPLPSQLTLIFRHLGVHYSL